MCVQHSTLDLGSKKQDFSGFMDRFHVWQASALSQGVCVDSNWDLSVHLAIV